MGQVLLVKYEIRAAPTFRRTLGSQILVNDSLANLAVSLLDICSVLGGWNLVSHECLLRLQRLKYNTISHETIAKRLDSILVISSLTKKYKL